MSQDVLGGFEHQVLLALLRIGEGAFTVPLVDELEALTGRQPTPAAVYTTLRRLEERGLLVSTKEPSPRGGRPRRVFRATPDALRALRRSKATLERLWDGLPVLDEAGA